MSDGAFNAFRSWKSQDQTVVSDRAKQICTNMKAQGIEIYTVGFKLATLGSSERATVIDTLKSCGTDIEHFYETFDAEQLQGAFRAIELQTSTLRMMK